MSRRAKKVRAAVTWVKPWTEAMAELFDLVGDDWSPPATVKVRRTARVMTVRALFCTPAGVSWTAHARIALKGDVWTQTEESLGATFSTKVTMP